MKKLIVGILIALSCSGCSRCHVDEIKAHADATWRQAGFEVIGYEGYTYGSFGTWGGEVWYTVHRIPDNGVIYHGFVSKWGSEYHLYCITAIDAIKPEQKR